MRTFAQVIEIDACRFDPSVVVRNSGCLAYDPMDKLSDIGYIRVRSGLSRLIHTDVAFVLQRARSLQLIDSILRPVFSCCMHCKLDWLRTTSASN